MCSVRSLRQHRTVFCFFCFFFFKCHLKDVGQVFNSLKHSQDVPLNIQIPANVRTHTYAPPTEPGCRSERLIRSGQKPEPGAPLSLV